MTPEPRDNPADAALLARLRTLWGEVDPVPEDLANRMVAAIAIDDLTRQWDLLGVIEDVGLAAVRGEADTRTLQFGVGSTNVLLHVSATEESRRRIDGWVDATVLAVRLAQGGRELSAEPSPTGRFAFESVPAGTARVRLIVKEGNGVREFMTPEFEA